MWLVWRTFTAWKGAGTNRNRCIGARCNILEQAWGPDNPQLLAVLQSYEALLRARQEYAEAESVQVRSTKIRVVEALRLRTNRFD